MPQNIICSDNPARPINVLLLTKYPMAMVHYDVGYNETHNKTRPGNLDMGRPFYSRVRLYLLPIYPDNQAGLEVRTK